MGKAFTKLNVPWDSFGLTFRLPFPFTQWARGDRSGMVARSTTREVWNSANVALFVDQCAVVLLAHPAALSHAESLAE